MSEATRPVGSGFVGGIVDLDRRLGVMETRFVRLAGNPVTLYDTTLTASAASITFSAIPQNFSHLQIECFLRSTYTPSGDGVVIRVNADTGLNYDWQVLAGQNVSATASPGPGQSSGWLGKIPDASDTAGLFGGPSATIPSYAGANNKLIRAIWTHKYDRTASGTLVGLSSTYWVSTAPITIVQLLPQYGSDFVASSRATLIGIP